MNLYPAIDLKDGAVVRLAQGDMARATTFSTDPAAQARAFAAAGFQWLHVVDLNGAFAGRSVNGAAVQNILDAVDIPLQLGGGVRDMAAIEAWLGKGVRRVVLGTAAVREPELVKAAARRFPERIVVGIDARQGKVAVTGWSEATDLDARDLARRFADAGVAAIVYTDIDRDGVLQGLNVEATLAVAHAVSIPVIASGGVASLADIERLMRPDCAVLDGVIIGRALYDERIDPGRALALAQAGVRTG